MPANMSRLAQVCGMSTRESLDRPRQGALRWQRDDVQDDRLNRAACYGWDGPATTVYDRRPNAVFPRQEKIMSKEQSVNSIVTHILRRYPEWKPSRWARKEYRNCKALTERPKTTARGLLG